ncbi:hypothetical protein ABIA31_004078 [Catenulispora sp. MAP5-51]
MATCAESGVEVGHESGPGDVAEGEDEQREGDVLHVVAHGDVLAVDGLRADQHRHDQHAADAAQRYRTDPQPSEKVSQRQAREQREDGVLLDQLQYTSI